MFRRSTHLACYFAEKPAASPARLVALARNTSHGAGVYSSRADALTVLRAVRGNKFPWWNAECDAFVAAVEAASAPAAELIARRRDKAAAAELPPLVLVEGLDGVGKTTVTQALADKLGAALLRTPDPSLDAVRGRFRVLEDVLGRAFYSGANYLAADVAAQHVLAGTPVVLDRWWPSTAAMAMSGLEAKRVPRTGSPALEWPRDLPRYTAGFLLEVDEEIRLRRMQKRGDENAEEKKLAESRAIRQSAMEAYLKLGPAPLTVVDVPTYMVAVNGMLRQLEALGQQGVVKVPAGLSAKAFTEAEMAECRPY